jgi:DNA polymerase III epsilon subunit-like protein
VRVNKLLVIDTETGGLDPKLFSILSLGASVWRDGAIEDSFEVFIAEPELKTEAEALAVNQINLDWLKSCGFPPPEAVARFHLFLDKNFGAPEAREKINLVGHNVSFDVGFLKRLYAFTDYKYGDIFSHRVLDTAGIVRFLIIAGKLPLESAGSTALFEYFKIKVEEGKRHTALGDAVATARLLNHLIDVVK